MVERVLRQQALAVRGERKKLHNEHIRARLAGHADRIIEEDLARRGSEWYISKPQPFGSGRIAERQIELLDTRKVRGQPAN